jgi:hypothetical protein
MALNTLVSVASLVSSLAVLVSVFYLALQIRQSARNQRSLIDRGRSEQIGGWLQFIASPDMAPLVIRGHAGETLSPEERQRYVWAVYPMILHYEDSFYQHREGMMSEVQFTSICNQVRDSARYPGVRMIWAEVHDRFPADFQRFADPILQEPPQG